MEDRELAQRITALEDHQLLCMLTVDSEQYIPRALELGKSEAARRGLAITAPPPDAQRPSVHNAALEALTAMRKAFGAGRFVVAERQVSCSHCGGELFQERQALLNTRLRTLFKLDWLDRAATALVCERCGLIQWFFTPPERQ
jgi:hypothetical protein